MFGYRVHLNHEHKRHSYSCTRYRNYAGTYDHIQHKDNDDHYGDRIYHFIQVHSVSLDEPRWTYNTEFFPENVHMCSADVYDQKQACTTCKLRDREFEQEVLSDTKKRDENSEYKLWNYCGMLNMNERTKMSETHTTYDFSKPQQDSIAGISEDILREHTQESKHTTKKGRSIHNRLSAKKIKTHRMVREEKIHIEAKLYALSRSKFVFQDFAKRHLVMNKETEGFCCLSSRNEYKYEKGTIEYAFNHYMDDYKYVRIIRFKDNIRPAVVCKHESDEYTMSLYSVPTMTYDESVKTAYEMVNSSSELRHIERHINVPLLASGIRQRHGAICVHRAMIKNISKSIQDSFMYQNTHKLCECVGFEYVNDTYKVCDVIVTFADYCLFFNHLIKDCMVHHIFAEDFVTVMEKVDRVRQGKAMSIAEENNIRIKCVLYSAIQLFLSYSGIMVDPSDRMFLGIRDTCEQDCDALRHEHRTNVYIDMKSDMLHSNLEYYLQNIRYIACVADILGIHMRQINHGEPNIILTDESIQSLDTLYLRDEITKGMYFVLNEHFKFDEIGYSVVLAQIRNREYEFLQVHNASCFTFSKILKLVHTVQQTKEYTKPIYFFNLGYIHLSLPDSLAEHEESVKTVIHNHLILIGENNIRFKTDICTKKEYIQSDKQAYVNEDMYTSSDFVVGNAMNQFCNTYFERIEKYFVIHNKTKHLKDTDNVHLNILSGEMHSMYSSICATFTFMDSRPMRIYKAEDIKIEGVNKSTQYIYHRAHSFSVTITGAFTSVLDEFGKHYESQRKCSHTCASSQQYCHKCVHNVVFCAKGSIVERYISAKFEEFIPYIVSLYEYYSFNGGSTEECDLDRKIFEKHHSMIACGHSIEFLYNADAAKMAELQSEIVNNTISTETMNKILNDPSFSLIHIEPINETYGQIKTCIMNLYRKILRHYVTHRRAPYRRRAPAVLPHSEREKWISKCETILIKYEDKVEKKFIAERKKRVKPGQIEDEETEKRENELQVTKLLHMQYHSDYSETKELERYLNDYNSGNAMNEYYDTHTQTQTKKEKKKHKDKCKTEQAHKDSNKNKEKDNDTNKENESDDQQNKDTDNDKQHTKYNIAQEQRDNSWSAQELEEYAQELQDTVHELASSQNKYKNMAYTANPFMSSYSRVNVEYLGTSKLETNLNRNHSFSCDNVRVQRYSKCHHSFRNPGKLLSLRKRINKPHHLQYRGLCEGYSTNTKLYTIRKSYSLSALDSM